MKRIITLISIALCAVLIGAHTAGAQNFKINEGGYFNCEGVDAMAFDDFYPEGHQDGISFIMNGKRVATNGDIRFDETPGQWQPVPKKLERIVDGHKIITRLCYPDSSRHETGFNPMVYPDIQLFYTVSLEPQGKGFLVTVDLETPIPAELQGKAGFNMEFFPGELFGKPWIMDSKTGIYPQQPNSPVIAQKSYMDVSRGDYHDGKSPLADIDQLNAEGYSPFLADRIVAEPYAVGRTFTSRPDDPYSRITIKSFTADLKLYDGRMNHNNGWFGLRSEIPEGATNGAIQWYIEPSVVEGWLYKPVVQTSQVGYKPLQPKVAVIETDKRAVPLSKAELIKYEADGEKVVRTIDVEEWNGNFLRYKYLMADFSDVTESGLYSVKYGDSSSSVFNISDDVFDRGVWQPVIEYFLPVQMCHMRVSEKYRVWHDKCHMDDARLAPTCNHIDGYVQQEDDMTPHVAMDVIENLNVGGWHDAGDFDLRVESQSGECFVLAKAFEEFKPEIDATCIDQKNHLVEIHQPDGMNDMLQQIEHGALTVVNGYLALGRLYRGIICNNLRQYVLLGDAAAMTDGILGNEDDRWVFTEDNPAREMNTATNLAVTARVLRGFNDTLSVHCENIAKEIFANTRQTKENLHAAAELYQTTGEKVYFDYILQNWDTCIQDAASCAWFLAPVEKEMAGQKKYRKQCAAFREALLKYRDELDQLSAETPYGVPYRPNIWGAGWDIQAFGCRHYFLVKSYPEIFAPDQVFNAMNFILGCHPGLNQQSFASGVGAESATVGYGLNRADWSYIPGGVVSGTALIRPDFPELLVFPYLWQQVEYVLGGGSSHYMFLVLATNELLNHFNN